MTGRFGLEMQPKDLSEEDKERTKEAIKAYKSIRDIVQLGDQYRLLSPYNDLGLTSTMFVTKDKSKAVVFAYSLKENLGPKFPPVQLNGLNPEKKYKVKEINKIDPKGRGIPSEGKVFSGSFLMNVGLQMNLRGVYTSRAITLTEID